MTNIIEAKFGDKKPEPTPPPTAPVRQSSGGVIRDVVFDEHYGARVNVMLNQAFQQGRQHELNQLIGLIREFESKKIEVTADGIVECIVSLQKAQSGTT